MQDQGGIVARLHVKAEEVQVQRISSAVGAMFLVQAVGGEWCGAANCEVWVLDDHYRLLLQKSAQGFRLLTAIHEGRPDVMTSTHGSGADASLSYWESHGGRYSRVACADATYEEAGGVPLKTPRIAVHPCGTEE